MKIEHRPNDLCHSVQKAILYSDLPGILEKSERKMRRLAITKRYVAMKRPLIL